MHLQVMLGQVTVWLFLVTASFGFTRLIYHIPIAFRIVFIDNRTSRELYAASNPRAFCWRAKSRDPVVSAVPSESSPSKSCRRVRCNSPELQQSESASSVKV